PVAHNVQEQVADRERPYIRIAYDASQTRPQGDVVRHCDFTGQFPVFVRNVPEQGYNDSRAEDCDEPSRSTDIPATDASKVSACDQDRACDDLMGAAENRPAAAMLAALVVVAEQPGSGGKTHALEPAVECPQNGKQCQRGGAAERDVCDTREK